MASKRNPKPRRNASRSTSRAQRRERRVVATDNPMVRAVQFHRDGSRTLELTDAGGALMAEHLEATRTQFRQVWGREMRADDPVFPDFDSPEPAPMAPASLEAQMVAVMEEAGIHPAQIYAFQQSGLLLTEANQHFADPDAVAEWNAAIDRWHRLHG